MAAAAAVIRARMEEDSDHDLLTFRMRSEKPLNMTRCATTCAGLVVAFTGLGFLISAVMNSRVESLERYRTDVREWEAHERSLLKDARIKVTASLPSISYLQEPTSLDVQLQPREEESWTFHDSEAMKGVEQYQPLKQEVEVELPCLYQNCSMLTLNAANQLQPKDYWMAQVLPSWKEAPRASFHFHLEGGGQDSSFATPELPLIFDLPTVGQTPQPRNFCYGAGHGVFRQPGTCHHSHRLTEICVALEFEEGQWKLRHAPPSPYVVNTSRRTGTFGCNPQTGYEATTYEKDPCWGALPNRRLCELQGPEHKLRITVRAWDDPYIRAAELTHGTFDFGLSPTTELTAGSVLLSLGVCMVLVPNLLHCPCAKKRLLRKTPSVRTFGRAS